MILKESDAQNAKQFEISVANRLEEMGFTLWAEPSGDDSAFPDIGATIQLSKPIHVHIEVKLDASAQLGSIRNWIYNDRKKFYLAASGDDFKEQIIQHINSDARFTKRASEVLNDMRKYLDSKITDIKVSSLGHIPVAERGAKIEVYKQAQAKKLVNYQIGKLQVANAGQIVSEHYNRKFVPRAGGKNILLFFIGKDISMLKHDGVSKADLLKLSKLLTNGPDAIPLFDDSFAGQIEIRIQPRSRGTIDTMMSFRAKQGMSMIPSVPFDL